MGEEQKYRYIQYVPQLGIDGEMEAAVGERHAVGDEGDSKEMEGLTE